MSHHPPISALYVTNRKDGFTLSATILAKSKFYGKYIQNHRAFKVWLFDFISFWFFLFFCFFFFGKKSWTFSGTLLTLIFFHLCVLLGNSLSALLDGSARLTLLPRGEDYLITMPYAHCKGILLGTLTMEMGGEANTLQLFSRVVLWVPIRTASKQIFFRVLDKSLEWGATGGGEERGGMFIVNDVNALLFLTVSHVYYTMISSEPQRVFRRSDVSRIEHPVAIRLPFIWMNSIHVNLISRHGLNWSLLPGTGRFY